MSVSSVASSPVVASADARQPASVLVAKKALDATKAEGQSAVQLIQSATPAPTGDGRGQLVSAYA